MRPRLRKNTAILIYQQTQGLDHNGLLVIEAFLFLMGF